MKSLTFKLYKAIKGDAIRGKVTVLNPTFSLSEPDRQLQKFSSALHVLPVELFHSVTVQ